MIFELLYLLTAISWAMFATEKGNAQFKDGYNPFVNFMVNFTLCPICIIWAVITFQEKEQ